MADLIQIDVEVNSNANQATKGLDVLTKTIIHTNKTAELLKKQYKGLDRAFNTGKMSAQVYAKSVQALDKSMDRLYSSLTNSSNGINRTSKAMVQSAVAAKTATGAMNQFGKVSAIGGKRMNRTNMIIQQSGYQFQDFAVQIQGGTNAFVALGQQGSQLLGVFGPAGAVLGAFLAVGTAIARMKTAGSELSFDFKRFGADIAKSLEPIKPVLSAIGSAFSAVGEVLSGAANFIVQNLSRIITVAITAGAAFGTYFAAGVIKAALSVKTLSKALIFLRNNLIKTGIGALVVAAGLLVHEFMRVVDAVGSFGLAFNMVLNASKEIFNRLVNLAKVSFYEMMQATSAFTTDILISIKSLIVNYGEGFNQIGAMTKGLIAGIKALFMQLPKAVGDQAKLAANSFIDGMEALANGALGAINRVIDGFKDLSNYLGADKAMEFFGFDIDILKPLDNVDLSKYKSETSTAAKTLADTFAEAYKEAFDQSSANKPFLETINTAIADTMKLFGDLEQPLKDTKALLMAPTPELEKLLEAIGKGEKSVDDLASYFTLVEEESEDATKATEKFRKELESPMVKAIDSVSNAFGNFIANGLKDFKGFASSVLDSFKNMIAQMIATAARNKIMLSLGLGGGALGTAAAAGGGGTGSSIANLGVLGNAVSSFAGSGIASGLSSALGIGGYAGQGLFNVVANTQVAVAAGANAMAASIGAAIPPLLAVAAVFGMFRSRTKELDSGLRVTVDNMDVIVKTFKTIQKSKFFGLVKSVRTTEEEASSEVSDPIVNAVATIQESVMEAASAFGVASDKFDDFTYDFEVSLKGLTEDQKVKKLNEEFTKLGDSFTETSGLFSNMNDLMTVYQQRLALENQLLVAQGDVVKLRELELETIHVLNRDLATRIHLLQAEGDTQSALTAFASGISEQQGLIRRAVGALVKPLQDAIDRTRTQAEKSYNIFKTAADKSVDSAKNIVDIITSALDSRTIRSESAELLRYQTAQKQLASFAGGASFDEASLRRATEGVSIDSQKFFGSFEDYARDFYRTQISLEDLADVAEKELSEVEQQIDIAQKAYEVAIGTHQETVDLNAAIETLAQDLNIYEATKLANEPLIKMVQDEGNRQIELLDSILVETTKQVNTQLGIESSMADLVGNTVSIGEAMGVLGLESESLAGGVFALEDIEKDINGNVTDLGLYIVDFDGSVKKLDESVFNMTGTVDNLDGDITSLFNKINLLDGGVDSLGVKVGELGLSTGDLGIDVTNLGETLTSAMTSLGSIVSTLSNAVSDLSISNDNLATAQQKAENASKISSITTTAVGIVKEIEDIETAERGAGTPTAAQENLIDIYEKNLQAAKSATYLPTGEYNRQLANAQGNYAGALAAVAPAEMSPEDSATLANLFQNLETLRVQIRDLGGTPTFSSGGYHSGGMRLVGENGPELEATGPSRIYSAQQTRNMLSGGSGEVVVELRSLRREVSELKAEQRKVGVENVKYNKKSYDLYREWDTVGLPATRTA